MEGNKKVYLDFKINNDNTFSLNKIEDDKKPSSAMAELKIIEKIVKDNISKDGSNINLNQDAKSLKTLQESVLTIADGFNQAVSNKLISIQGKFFPNIRSYFINKRKEAIQKQMQKLQNLINQKLNSLELKLEENNPPKENIQIEDPKEDSDNFSPDKLFQGYSEMVERFYRKPNHVEEIEIVIEEEPDPKIEEKIVIEEEEEPDPKIEIIEKEEIKPLSNENRVINNRKMIEDVNKTPKNFINYLEETLRSDFKQNIDSKKLNELVQILFQLFPDSAFEDFTKQLTPQVVKKEGDTFEILINFCRKSMPGSAIYNYVNNLATKIVSYKKHFIKFFEPNQNIDFLTKQIINIALGSSPVNFVLDNKNNFKEEVYDNVKEDSKLKSAMNSFSIILFILKDDNIGKDAATTAITQAIMNIVVLTLEAISDHNSKKEIK